jgi:hypothetical protein
MSRRGLLLLAALAVGLAFAGPALARDRSVWRHKDGHYENTRANEWTEKHTSGTYKWTETKRTDEYVELKKEGWHIRLYKDRVMYKPDGGDWERRYTGKWD